MFVKAEGPSGYAEIHSDDPIQALGLAFAATHQSLGDVSRLQRRSFGR